eukprot:4549052-Amphidinium_carterae.1
MRCKSSYRQYSCDSVLDESAAVTGYLSSDDSIICEDKPTPSRAELGLPETGMARSCAQQRAPPSILQVARSIDFELHRTSVEWLVCLFVLSECVETWPERQSAPHRKEEQH